MLIYAKVKVTIKTVLVLGQLTKLKTRRTRQKNELYLVPSEIKGASCVSGFVLIFKLLRRFLLNAKADIFEHPSTLLFGARKSDHIRIGIESNIGR